MQEKKKKSEPSKEKEVSSYTSKYVPKPEGEDAQTTKEHKEWLQSATKIRKKGTDVVRKIDILMEKTLYDRRQKIVIENMPIAEVLEEYPWLKNDGLLKEFNRISHTNAQQQMLNFLSDYGDSLLRKMRLSEIQSPGILKELISEAKKGTGSNQKYLASCIAILSVTKLMGEKVENVLGNTIPEPCDAPVFIRYSGDFLSCTSFEMFVEGELVCESGDLVEVYVNYLAAYYVFNIVHPSSLQRTLAFMDKVVLKESNKVLMSVQKKVCTLIADLNVKSSMEKRKGSKGTPKNRKTNDS